MLNYIGYVINMAQPRLRRPNLAALVSDDGSDVTTLRCYNYSNKLYETTTTVPESKAQCWSVTEVRDVTTLPLNAMLYRQHMDQPQQFRRPKHGIGQHRDVETVKQTRLIYYSITASRVSGWYVASPQGQPLPLAHFR